MADAAPRATILDPTAATDPAEESAAVRLIASRGEEVLNAVDDGIFYLNSLGRVEFINESGARMLGFTQREVLGHEMHALVHHHYSDGSPFPRESCPIWHTVTDGVQQRIGGDTFFRKDNSPLPVDYTSIPLKERRRVLGVVVTFRDVTNQLEARREAERAAAERAAREEAERSRSAIAQSVARFRALSEAAGQIIWTNSAEGRMEGEQPGWARLTGQTPEEYSGFGWADALHPDDREATVAEWNRCVATRSIFVFEHRVRRADGVYRLFAVRGVPILEEDGRIREWVGTHTDITEQRAARDAAERARHQMLNVFEQAPAAIATTAGPSHVFQTANARYRQLVGNRDLVGRPVGEALYEESLAPFIALLDQVYATGEPFVGTNVSVEFDRDGDGELESGVFDFVYQPLRGESGEVEGIMIHAVEIGQSGGWQPRGEE